MEQCRHCGMFYDKGLRTCPRCGNGTVSFGEAFLKRDNWGILDLIPGIRDLPAVVKLILAAIIILLVLGFLL